ncbi:MAG: HEAT repeat domain-containing protein [Haloarculaceae archaeon]
MTSDGPYDRAIDLAERAREDPDAVDRDEIIELLGSESSDARRYAIQAFRAVEWSESELESFVPPLRGALRADDPILRNSALQALTDVASRDVSLVEPVLDDVADLLSDEQDLVRSSTVEFLYFVGQEDAEAIRPCADELLAMFDGDPSPGQRSPLYCLALLAREDVDPVVDELHRFVDVFVDGPDDRAEFDTREIDGRLDADQIQNVAQTATKQRRDYRVVAGDVIVSIARQEPAAVVDHLPDLAPFADDPVLQIRVVVLDVLGALAMDYPERVLGHLPALAAALDDGRPVSAHAVKALGALSQERPDAAVEAVSPHADKLIDLLDHAESEVRSVAAGLLSYLGAEQPETVEPALPDARDLLDDEHPYVRGNAVWIVEAVGDESDRETLKELAESDPNPQVREAAETAAQQL